MKNYMEILLMGIATTVILFAMSITANAASVKVTGDILNVREKPSTSSNVVAKLSKDTECELLEEQDGWFKIKYKKYIGYVSKDYVKKIETDTDINKNNKDINNETTDNKKEENTATDSNIEYKVVNKDTDLKILPLIYSSVIGNLKSGEEVVILTQTTGWSYIQTETISGWVRSEFLGEKKPQNIEKPKENNVPKEKVEEEKPKDNKDYKEKKGYINEEFVNVREQPSTDSKRIKVLALNNEVNIIGEDGKWYKIKSGEDVGYIMKEFISDSKKVSSRSLTNSRTKEVAIKKEEKKNTEDKKQLNIEKNTNSNQVVDYAKQFLGVPYVYGGSTPKGFDCSGFTMYVCKHFGISLSHSANAQYTSGKGTKVNKQSDLKVGDLVFLTEYKTGKGIGHCGIYMGDGKFIHASSTAKKVTISSFNTDYRGRFYSGLRVL